MTSSYLTFYKDNITIERDNQANLIGCFKTPFIVFTCYQRDIEPSNCILTSELASAVKTITIYLEHDVCKKETIILPKGPFGVQE